jgi:hypothetical protein
MLPPWNPIIAARRGEWDLLIIVVMTVAIT